MKYDLSQIEFKNEKRFLSNMWKCNIKFGQPGEEIIPGIFATGLVYPSSEHIYQALKSDSIEWHHYLLTLSPEGTKTAAQNKIKTLIANNKTTFLLRDDFHHKKIDIMEYIVTQKFKQNPELLQRLKNIHGDIEERNCWGDTFWGTVNGYGDNHLGKILMKVRDEIL